MVKESLDCRDIRRIAAAVEYRQAAESMQWSPAEGPGFTFPSVRLIQDGEKGEVALAPASMTANLQIHLRAVHMEDKWYQYTTTSFRVGRAASHTP